MKTAQPTTITLNIGLAPGKGSNMRTTHIASISLHMLSDYFGRGFKVRCEADSRGETTMIVRITLNLFDVAEDMADVLEDVRSVARATEQDCIAVTIETETMHVGALVGPRWQDWGTFDPTKFINF